MMRFHILSVVCFTLLVSAAACTDSTGTTGATDSAHRTDSFDGSDDTSQTSGDTDGTNDSSSGDAEASDTRTTDDDTSEDDTSDGQNGFDDVYTGSGDPFAGGGLSVSETSIEDGDDGPPRPIVVWAPEQEDAYAVVVFQHGFLLQNSYYSIVLEQLASHGFIVVAPQMYSSSNFPSTPEEADRAEALYDWLEGHLSDLVAGTANFDHFGLAGHSRGGKVIWTVMSRDSSRADALAGVDPVDGTGGPGASEERIIDGSFGFSLPVFVLGTGLGPVEQGGQACAPEGENHVQFYGASQSPAWHVVATEHGHQDMLDDETPQCFLACSLCPSGDDKPAMRTLTAGMLVAFFRASLQGDERAYDVLEDSSSTSETIEVENK